MPFIVKPVSERAIARPHQQLTTVIIPQHYNKPFAPRFASDADLPNATLTCLDGKRFCEAHLRLCHVEEAIMQGPDGYPEHSLAHIKFATAFQSCRYYW
jgi:hypothetical protein